MERRQKHHMYTRTPVIPRELKLWFGGNVCDSSGIITGILKDLVVLWN
jgi:tetrahydromethanopterin S-methyltransferase subunit F